MKEQLNNLLNKAYAPYSHFSVACIIETNDGKLFAGVNIENASYGATICAERVAIVEAIKNGYHQGDFKNIYLMASDQSKVVPCFICRQVMTEFFSGDETLFIYYGDNIDQISIKELLPYPFKLEQNHA